MKKKRRRKEQKRNLKWTSRLTWFLCCCSLIWQGEDEAAFQAAAQFSDRVNFFTLCYITTSDQTCAVLDFMWYTIIKLRIIERRSDALVFNWFCWFKKKEREKSVVCVCIDLDQYFAQSPLNGNYSSRCLEELLETEAVFIILTIIPQPFFHRIFETSRNIFP